MDSSTPRYFAASRSNAATFGPRMNSPLVSTPSIASRMRGSRGSYCAFTSTSGIGGTIRESRRPPPAHQQIGRETDDRGDDRVFHIAEVVVEPLVAPSEPVAHSREPEGPDRRADQRQHAVAPEAHPEDSRGDRDERPDHGRDAADQHREVIPAVEPTLGPVELLGAQVQPASAALEQRPPAVAPDRPTYDRAEQIAERACQGHRDVCRRARRDACPEEI